MLEPLIDIIDKIDEKTGEDDVYLPLNLLKENFSKYLNQVLIEKIYGMMVDTTYDKEEILKFELYCLFILLCKGSFEAKINSKYLIFNNKFLLAIFNVFCINEEDTLFSQDLILLIKSTIYGIFRVCKIPLPHDDEIKNLLSRHFPLVFTDEYFELTFEEFGEWVSKNDEVHSFLMEFFELQTRYNAMKAYIKYLSEFEYIFDSNKIDDEAIKAKKLPRKSNIFDKSNFMLFSKEETTAEANEVYIIIISLDLLCG
jgi:hypothetical protein